jgi:hypothetical protein
MIQPTSLPVRQQGIVLVLYAIGMFAMLIVGGLALDGAHAMLNKNRLQTTVDAAALSAAKTLDQTADTAQAQTAALAMIASNADNLGNRELATAYASGNGDINVTVEFSATVAPFAAGSLPANYVRVRAENFTMSAWLVQLMGMDEKIVAATAVAGPSPTLGASCKLVPLIVCGDPDQPPSPTDPTAPIWGYERGDVHVLKGGSDSGGQKGPIGPGSFQLARPGDASGSYDLAQGLAGGSENCSNVGDSIDTEPGNKVGPTVAGINTRLNKYPGFIFPGDYPPDVVTEQQESELQVDDSGVITLEDATGTRVPVNSAADLDFNYQDYSDRLKAKNYDLQPDPIGPAALDRRNMPIYIANCEAKNTGQSTLPILGFGCFFLLQEAIQNGTEAELYGEFQTECPIDGVSGNQPTTIPGPYRIQLYKDSGSYDS